MKRILYSQNESPIKDDYFVIDGVLEKNNVSDLSMKAFQLVKSIENWKIMYEDDELIIRKNGKFLSVKSHYINKDESGRFLFYVYYVESNNIEKMLDDLKTDSIKINKEVAFETEKLIERIKKNKNIEKIIIGIILTLIISIVLWETVK